MSAEDDFDTRLEAVLDCLHGPRESFRKTLIDRDTLLRKVCDYAEIEAKRRRIQPWSIIGSIMGHGSGVSSAIYELYRAQKKGGAE